MTHVHHIRLSTEDIFEGAVRTLGLNGDQRCVDCGEPVMVTFGEGKGHRSDGPVDLVKLRELMLR